MPNPPPTQCLRDHDLDEASTYIDPTGKWHCRKCAAFYGLRHRKKQRQIKLDALRTPFEGIVEDLHWFAGMFEGEGTISIRGRRQRYTAGAVVLTSTDAAIPQAYRDQWGGWLTAKAATEKWRAATNWLISGPSMYRFLWQIRPALRRPLVINRATAALAAHEFRQQGTRRGTDYAATNAAYQELMTVLNHRGSSRLAEPDQKTREVAEAFCLFGMPLQWRDQCVRLPSDHQA